MIVRKKNPIIISEYKNITFIYYRTLYSNNIYEIILLFILFLENTI